MATSEGIPSSIDIEFLELNDNPYIKVGKKADSISTLLKFLRRWKMKYSAICSPVMI